MKWIDTENATDMAANSIEFWQGHRVDLQTGAFWADQIKQYRDQPDRRLQLAIENLPLPGAFREAAIAIRALIRGHIKKKHEFVDQLAFLYWLAAVDSFCLPYSEYLRQPGYNVMESVPGSVVKTLPFSYSELGYKHLSLLNKTDIKWCVMCWGEPVNHTTLNALHSSLWRKYEIELKLCQQQESDAIFS